MLYMINDNNYKVKSLIVYFNLQQSLHDNETLYVKFKIRFS